MAYAQFGLFIFFLSSSYLLAPLFGISSSGGQAIRMLNIINSETEVTLFSSKDITPPNN
jgi:hypothetical protein